MSLQYGLYPIKGLNIPTGFCNPPTPAVVTMNGDIVTFSWTLPHDVVATQLQVSEQNSSDVVLDVQVTGTRYVFQLEPNTTYTWWIKNICDREGFESTTAAGVSFTTGNHVITCLPINLTSVIVTPDVDSVLLYWPIVANAIGYVVYYKIAGTTFSPERKPVQVTSVLLTNLNYNTKYEYWIEVLCSNGSKVSSEHGSFITPVDNESCPQPVVKAVVNGKSAVIAWDAKDVLYFDIFLDNSLIVNNFPGNVFNFNDLAYETSYTVKVVGKCEKGNSITGSVTFKTEKAVCGNIASITQTLSSNGLLLKYTWPVVPQAVSYTLVIEGSTFTTTNAEYEIAVKPGTTVKGTISATCSNDNKSIQPLNFTYTVPFTCDAVDVVEVTRTITPTTLTFDFKDVSGAARYYYKYKKVADSTYSDVLTTTNSVIKIGNLVPGTNYDLNIKSICDTDESEVTTQFETPALYTGLKPTITAITDVTTDKACIAFTMPDGSTTGNFRIRLQTDSSEFIIPTSALGRCVYNLTPGTTYSVTVSAIKPDHTQVWSDPVNVTTCVTPAGVTDVDCSYNSVGNIDIYWEGPAGAVSYDIYYGFVNLLTDPTGSSISWVFKANTTDLNYQIADVKWEFRKIKIITKYAGTCQGLAVEVCPKPPKPVELKAEVEGTIVSLSWKDFLGVNGYKVKYASLQGGTFEDFTKSSTFDVKDALPQTVYSFTVQSVGCDGELSIASDTVSFTTGDTSLEDNGCAQPTFSFVVQNSKLTDPDPDDDNIDIDNSAAATINYETYKGDTFDRTLTFKDQSGAVINITGYTFEMPIINPDNGQAIITLINDSGITVDGASGTIVMNVSNLVTATWDIKKYAYTLRWTLPDNTSKIIVNGTVNVISP